jgi:hypothetical protein
MNKNIVLTCFLFGCWLKFFPGAFGIIGRGIWLGIVITWMLLCAGGILHYLFDKKNAVKIYKKQLTPDMRQRWILYNLTALVSFTICGEITIALVYIFTSVVYMIMVIESTRPQMDNH